MLIGEKLKELREAKGWNRATLAGAVGVSEGTIHNWERNRFGPSMSSALKLCAVLDELASAPAAAK
jgi:DNA-binding XRE family transcriptional regulator